MPGEATHEWTGRVLGGQFRLQQPLGRGGMGQVYLAEQLEVGRPVVIKLLNAQSLKGSSGEARFRREAQALAQLNHPNIVQLYAFGRSDDDTPYLAMEFIAGRTLGDLVAEHGALPELEVCRILDQLCDALAEAHRHGVIHRDLKPDNVMISAKPAGRVKILDFGIAKLTHAAAARLTQHGELLGTPQYMAPEQLGERAADERTDIYALGLVGYELLTGQVPFEADTALSLMMKVLNDTVVPPRLKAPEREVSPALDALIARCLEKDPEHRFQSAEALREALGQLTAAAPMSLSLAVRAERETAERVPRRTWLAWTFSLALGALAALYFGGSLPWLASQSPDTQTQWIQGIPFPAGSSFPSFQPLFIEAQVAADPDSVIAFYQKHLAKRWLGYRALPQGMVFEHASAPVEQLTVTPLETAGSRIVITRRPRSD